MKKIILILLVLLLVGCGKVENKKEIIKERKNEYSLISTAERLVFKKENNYEIIYLENSKVFKVETAVLFETEKEAERYYKMEKYGSSNDVKYIYNIFVKVESEDYFEDYKELTKDELIKYMEKAEYEYQE